MKLSYTTIRRRPHCLNPSAKTSHQLVISPTGELDVLSSSGLERVLRAAVRRGHRRIVLDLRDVTFADCAFLHVATALYERLHRRGGSLRIVNARRPVQRVLTFGGLPCSVPESPSRDSVGLAPRR